jgi:RNA recognition motif-containing protein
MKNIFIGNLNSGTTSEVIRSLFEPIGTVHSFKLMTDRDTGQSRGFAFVEMVEAQAGQAIAALDGRMVDGQTIQVREGRPKLHRGRSLPERIGSQLPEPRVS